MNDKKNKLDLPKTPCMVDRGVIFEKPDMVRLLQGLDHVEYTEYLKGKPLITREGYVIEIFEDEREATLFFNRRIHINVNSFEYIKVNYNFELAEQSDKPETEGKKENAYSLELCMGAGRSIVLKPLSDPIDTPNTLVQEVEERRRSLDGWEEVTADAEDE